MKRLIVDDDVIELFPELQINVLTLSDIKNQYTDGQEDHFAKLLADATASSTKFTDQSDTFSKNPVIAEWREAYRKFKTKKGARSSIEALLKRASQGHVFSPIDPLVDIYNSISLTYGTPVGGEDVDHIDGDMHLAIADGGEPFFPLGAEEDSPALPGEVIYKDDSAAICRCFNWREAERTMLTDATKNAVLVIESINNEQASRANEAINELKTLCETTFNVSSTTQVINTNNRSATIAD
ncbi:B3/4 domain-containing protein [Lentilactobacillus sp. SPB1-3]|uniref:B3/4 domain-containing protein n=1 Tax=Lentilactobacillus terminaliae TaxID=3003483 RepID=A0ACD5DEK6_9LACO|nr:phenylalanine--tRNA ligase beta subunit-related protein [Lentilactobacillus sp. SPB1-3]MCZ0976339.1 phenylalanine--tRNA ligase beta subunit-related protein [Lentilactobacillus sp. SPB1-3]